MVRKSHNRINRRLFAGVTAMLMALSAGDCSKQESVTDPGAFDYQDEDRFADDDGEAKVSKMQGPQKPPEGVPYDEWKHIEYEDGLDFECESFAALHVFTSYDDEDDEPYRNDPADFGFSLAGGDAVENPIKILDARIEPIGGEMELRSSGYVKVVIESQSSTVVKIREDDPYDWNKPWGYASFIWWNTEPQPADLYTGTALINYNDEDDDLERSTSVGEADVSNMIKSDISWNGRIYRIYVSAEHKNASWEDSTGKDYASYSVREQPMLSYDTLTFLLPADYDGLILQMPKSTVWEKEYMADVYGNALNTDDYYADMLTDFRGEEHDPDEYYFVKVTDLLQRFDTERADKAL